MLSSGKQLCAHCSDSAIIHLAAPITEPTCHGRPLAAINRTRIAHSHHRQSAGISMPLRPTTNALFCRWESAPDCGLARSYRASSRSSVRGSAPATSSIFTRLRVPATSVTERRPTPNAAATEASAAAVAFPSAAGSLTRTTKAPSCSPPTPGRADPGRTRTATRTLPVCAPPRRPAAGSSRLRRPAPRPGRAWLLCSLLR
jgi:hypothetical protein